MTTIMRNNFNKYCLIILLIIGIHALTIHSYGDNEYLNYENDEDISNPVTYESLIESIHDHHRARRAPAAPAAATISADTTQSSITTNTSAIYIISGYSDSGLTTALTTNAIQTSQTTSISSTTSITTNSITNGSYIITGFFPFTTTSTTTTTTTTTATTTTTSGICNNGTYIMLTNGTCASRQTLIGSAISILNSNSSNDTQKADALTTYITAITNSTITQTANNTLTIGQIDGILGNLTNLNYTVNTSDSIIVITQPSCGASTTVIGASFETGSGPAVINTNNSNNIINSFLSAAGVVNFTGQCNVNQFNILIINNPTTYQTSDNSTNSTLVSSIIMAKIATTNFTGVNVTIQLYFQDITGSKPTQDGTYSCAFYDTKSSQWNQSGCFMLGYNSKLQRYECTCNHLTSFAMIWLPKSPSSNGQPSEYNAQDKASIAFQVISIICFIGIIIHVITVRILHQGKYSRTTHLLPIMSCGVTIILFIFYIALGSTVYTNHRQSPTNIQTSTQRGRTFEDNSYGRYIDTGLNSRASDQSSSNSSSTYIPCSSTEQGLMFVVYFFIIFMFCTKTSIGIDNFRRYVQLYPPLSYRMFILMMGVSLLLTVIWLAVAAGCNSNSSLEITQIYDDKLCWFNANVNNYFLTIPVVIFLAINLGMFIVVIRYNINHVHEADEDVEYCHLRQRCIYIILVSGGTQGFGWLLGPVISVASPSAGNVLGWFFIIFNGLEGVWALILYIIVEKEGLDVTPRYKDYVAQQQLGNDNDNDNDDIDQQNFQMNIVDSNRRRDPLTNVRSDSPRNSFADLAGVQILHRANRANNNDRI